MIIETAGPEHYPQLLAVWENSVRATHDFITEDDIAFFKPLILEHAFSAVALRYIRNAAGAIVGFIGVHEGKIEMLFVLNEARGQGVGKQLLLHAMEHMAANAVDVNEQNPAATGFYQHMGFHVVSRSPLDDLGKPFPILHMRGNGRYTVPSAKFGMA